jgi:hypothetical protein
VVIVTPPRCTCTSRLATKKLTLSDVGYRSARLREATELPAHTEAVLVISIDGAEQRESILLDHAITAETPTITFSYSDPTRLNGRTISL